MKDFFRKASHAVSNWCGSPGAFALALFTVLAWALTGPIFHYSDTWQLVINTGTTIITFLMVFLIQSSQNRDGRILHLKINELIQANKTARNLMLDLDDLRDEELEALHSDFCGLKLTTEQRIQNIQNKRKK